MFFRPCASDFSELGSGRYYLKRRTRVRVIIRVYHAYLCRDVGRRADPFGHGLTARRRQRRAASDVFFAVLAGTRLGARGRRTRRRLMRSAEWRAARGTSEVDNDL